METVENQAVQDLKQRDLCLCWRAGSPLPILFLIESVPLVLGSHSLPQAACSSFHWTGGWFGGRIHLLLLVASAACRHAVVQLGLGSLMEAPAGRMQPWRETVLHKSMSWEKSTACEGKHRTDLNGLETGKNM